MAVVTAHRYQYIQAITNNMSTELEHKVDTQLPVITTRKGESVKLRSSSSPPETIDKSVIRINPKKEKPRVYSVSSDIIPQTIIVGEKPSRKRGNSRLSNTTTSALSNLTLETVNDSVNTNKPLTSSSIIDKDVISSNYDNLQKLNKNVNDKYRDLSSKNNIPKWSNVGFQSIFRGPKSKKSNISITSDRSSISSSSSNAHSTTMPVTYSNKHDTNTTASTNNNSKTLNSPDDSSNIVRKTNIKPIRKSSDSFDKSLRSFGPLHSLRLRHTTNDFTLLHSNVEANVEPYKRRRDSIFSLTKIRDDSDKQLPKNNNSNSKITIAYNDTNSNNHLRKNSDTLITNSLINLSDHETLSSNNLNVDKTRANRERTTGNSMRRNTSNTTMSFISTISHSSGGGNNNNNSSSNSANKNNPFIKFTKKIFRSKSSQHLKDTTEPVIPNSLGKFLHSSIGRHRSPVHFIHSTTGGIIDSGKSVYSFNPSVLNATNDAALAITQQDDILDSTNVAILHDLLKNLSSLKANYRNFNTQELIILSGNIWGIYCSVVVELFKIQRIWHLPAKIEDLNRILRFYIKLKTRSKIAITWAKLIFEIEEFIVTSLYVFENQVVFNYSNEDTINTALKRLGILWQIFYQEIYYDVVAILLPLETDYQNQIKLNDVYKRNRLSLTKGKNENNSSLHISNRSKSNDYNNDKDEHNINENNEVQSLDNYLNPEIIDLRRLDSDDTIMKKNSDYNSNVLSAITPTSVNSSSSNLITQMGNNMFLDLNIDFNKVNHSNANLNVNGNNNYSNNSNNGSGSGSGSSNNDKNNNYSINTATSTPNINVNINNYNSSSNINGNSVNVGINGKFSIEDMLLRCFRDSIVLPYYQNFIHSDEGVSKSFYTYILNEEEESGVTEEDKLILLQCLGILSTIQGKDGNQQIIEDLLEGVRMSI